MLRLSIDPRSPPPDRPTILRSWGLLAEDPATDPDNVARNLLLFREMIERNKATAP